MSDTPAKKADPKENVKKDEAPPVPTGVQVTPKGTGEVKRRRTRLILSFVLLVLFPSGMAATYYGYFASDRYAVGSSFVVRGFEAGGGNDLVSSFTGLSSSGSTTADSYIIRRYLQSGDILLHLEDNLALRSHYANSEIDPLSRFDDSKSFEEFILYWSRRITTTYDSTTGIVTFEVQAFDPDTSLLLAKEVLQAADDLINALSADARQDSLSFAEAEVERAEERLRDAQIALRQFRSTTGTVDPTVNALLDAELIAELQAQIIDIAAQISELEQQGVASSSPILIQLERRREAIQSQIDTRRAAVGAESENTASADNLDLFEGLQIEQTFAQQRYASALTSLEQARIDADRLQRYLAVFSEPLPPQEAIYPRRVRSSVLMAVASFMFWVIGTLLVYAVRDHLR